MQLEIGRTYMYLSTKKAIWDVVYHTYSKFKDAAQIY